jgi:predicted transcriptional regulator
MRPASTVPVAGLLLVFVLPHAIAAPGEGTLQFEPPARAGEVGNLSVPKDTYLAFYGIDPDVRIELQIQGDGLRLTQTNASEEYVSLGPNNWAAVPGTAQNATVPIPIGSGRIEVAGAEANLTLVLSLADAARLEAPHVPIQAPLQDVYLASTGWTVGPKTLEPYRPNVAEWPNDRLLVAPGLRHHLSPAEVTLEYDGPFALLLSGAEVRWTNATGNHTLRTGSWREPAPGDPSGLTAGQRYRSHHVALEGLLRGSLRLLYAGPYGHVVPTEATLDDARLLSVPIANGSFNLGGDERSYRNGSFLDVRGRFSVGLLPPQPADIGSSRLSARVSGDISSISENRAAAVAFGPTAAVLVAGTAASLAALLAFTAWGRDLLTVITGRNVTTPLAHPLRVKMLGEIARRPGITQSQLARETGVGLWLARYHLRILRRGRAIDVVRSQNTDTFFLNGGSFRFYASAEAPTPSDAPGPPKILMATALAELHHPIRRRIFETLRRAGPAGYAKMAETWKEMGVPPPWPTGPNVSYHAGLMERAGLVRRQRQGREVVWSLNVDLYNVLVERAERCLSDPGVRRIYAIVNDRPGLTTAQIAAAALAWTPPPSRAVVGEALARLERSGLLVHDAGGDVYEATPGLARSNP